MPQNREVAKGPMLPSKDIARMLESMGPALVQGKGFPIPQLTLPSTRSLKWFVAASPFPTAGKSRSKRSSSKRVCFDEAEMYVYVFSWWKLLADVPGLQG